MLEVDDYLKIAASNSKTAEAHLENAECSLHTLVERLDNCMKLLKEIPNGDLLLWEQLDEIQRNSQSSGSEELDPVGH